MFKVSNNYKNEIGKLGGRCFVSKVVIRDTEYNDDNIIDMSLNESVNPGDNFSLGSVASNTFEINLIDVDNNVIFEEAIVKPYIGLELDNKIEYIPLGVFTVDDVAIKDKKVKLECVDNMIKLEKAYFSDLKYPANINEVLKEICKKSNIACKSILPNYSIDEIKGYSFRQAIGIIATLVGCFARFNRLGELEIISYEDTDLRITPDTFFKFETNDKDYIVGKITAKKGEKTFSKGSNTEIIIDNPVITENIVNDLYNKFKDFTYRPYTLSWQGNPAVQAGDKVVISDVNGKEYNTLIMEQKLIYNGGIKSELKASGKTESSDKFDSKGSITQAMENYSIEQANIKKALIQKASIDSLDAIDARINNLYAQDLTVLNAKIRDLQSTKISTIEFNALESKLQHALIGKADINELNVAVERVGILEGKTLSVENQLAGNLTAKNFKANSITAGSGIIAEGAIGSAQISDLELNKLRAGDISTSKFRIISTNGSIQIVGNQILVNRDNINRVILGEYKKQDTTSDYGLLIRAKDGKTVMIDSDGVHNAGITDGAINNNKVADNANIAGNKLDINSVIREVNGATETIKGTRVQVGDRTLDIELSKQNNTITEHSKELSSQKASIQALDSALKFKVDNQTFTQSTEAIKGNINSLNSDLVIKINSSLNSAKLYTDNINKNLDTEIKNTQKSITDTTNKLNQAEIDLKKYSDDVATSKANLAKTEAIANADGKITAEEQKRIQQAQSNLNTAISKANEAESKAKAYADSKKQEAINTASTDATNKANNALNSAKEFTTAQITTTNSNLSKATSEINILKEQINTKVGQVDVENSIIKAKTENYGYAYKKDIIIYGDYNLYYPVVIKGGNQDVKRKIFINRSYWEQAPSEWNPDLATHHGGLELLISANFGGWGGANYSWNIYDLEEMYSRMFAGAVNCASNMAFAIFLRGGGKNGAIYHLYSDQPLDSSIGWEKEDIPKPTSPQIAYNGEMISFYKPAYEFYAPKPRTITPEVEDEIKKRKFIQLTQDNATEITIANNKINDVSTKLTQTKDSLQASVNSLNSTTQTITTNLTNTANDLSNKINTAKTDAINSSKSYADNKKNEAITSANSYTNSAKQQAIDSANNHANSIAEQKKNEAIVGARKIPDTRNDNQTPDWYIKNYPFQTITEFKFARVVKIPNASNNYNYGTLETKVPWNGSSGGYPTQIFRSSDYPTYQRHGINGTTWSSWEQIEDTQGSQSKADSALNNAKTYTNAQITTVNTRVSNAESSINVLKGQISTKVSQSDIDKTVNNIQIGGRNYGLDTGKMLETIYNVSFSSKLVFQKNKTYTLALDFDAENLVAGSQARIGCEFSIGFADGSRSYYGVWHYISDGTSFKGRKYVTFTIPNLDITDTPTSCRIYPDLVSSGKRFLGNFKLEEGNKPTDWTPAPEDIGQEIKDNITTVTEKINTVESTLTQKTNNINAAVSSVQSILNTKADGSTVSSMQSQLSSLNIGLNGIKLEVANKTDKGSIISAINQSAENISINASKINLNGATTFAKSTGFKAIEINNAIISFFDWEGSERSVPVGSIYSTRTDRDARKPGIAIGHEENSTFDIVFKKDNKSYSFVTFDNDNILETGFPIAFHKEISLSGYILWLGKTKRNSMYESTNGDFTIRTAHGLKIADKDNGTLTADLDANYTGFKKWDHKYFYAIFKPDEFNLSNGKGRSYFWTESGNSNIFTGSGINMKIQGDLTVTGRKNRIVKDTIYGDLALNAVESTECWFTDMLIEQSRTDANGDCIIWFDNKFLQTVNTSYKYKVDVTPIGEFASNGKLTYVRVVEKTEKYFKVRGTPNTLFDWTITAKQKGYERDRLEKAS